MVFLLGGADEYFRNLSNKTLLPPIKTPFIITTETFLNRRVSSENKNIEIKET